MTTSTPAVSSEDLLICTACGTQFDEINPQKLTSCRICDDPRQFVPLSGQAFTTLGAMKNSSYTNKYKDFEFDSRITSIWTEPKFAIGQRCILIRTPVGNVLWDCLTYLDHETVAYIKSQGGLEAILISHPHYYSTHLEWAEAFNCPVYLSVEDEEWLCRADKPVSGSPTDDVPTREFIGADSNEFGIPSRDGKVTGVQALKLGGHFPGSLVCLFDGRLMVADTLVTTPAGLGNWKDLPRPKGMNSFAFMWSIPNMIPLPPSEVENMWRVLKRHEYRSSHGAFVGTEVVAIDLKQRILDSMKIQVKNEGYVEHSFLHESLP